MPAPRRPSLTLLVVSVSLAPWLLGADCPGVSSGADAAVAPAPPVVEPIPDTYVATGTLATVRCVASDPNGEELTYRWAQESGTTANVSGANTAELTVTATSARDDLVFRVTVTDAGGASTSVTANVRVRRVSVGTPLPLQLGRTFTYAVREEVYTWTRPSGTGQLAGYFRATTPVEVGTAQISVAAREVFNGIEVWTLDITDSSPEGSGACDPDGAALAQCGGDPNLTCDATADQCRANKRLAQQVKVAQLDGQLVRWVDERSPALPVVDPTRPSPPDEGHPYYFDGFELLTRAERVQPAPPLGPLAYRGQLATQVPGTLPAGAMVAPADTGHVIEVFDGARRTDVLTTYRISHAFYVAGTGLTFFRWEGVPAGLETAARVGYRDAVLTGITPPL
jgi:hypothetical protein